jgi:transposase-like protein
MRTYSQEFKEAMLEKLLPPQNVGVPELSAETGIPKDTLYSWRSARRRAQGLAVPAGGQPAERWSSEEKFTVVVETAALTEGELGEYCRKKGLYAEQVAAWRRACAQANATPGRDGPAELAQRQTQAKRLKELEAELRRKEKALAEAAAWLVLQKKVQTLWGEPEDAK